MVFDVISNKHSYNNTSNTSVPFLLSKTQYLLGLRFVSSASHVTYLLRTAHLSHFNLGYRIQTSKEKSIFDPIM